MNLLWREPRRGDLDKIAQEDTGYYPLTVLNTWIDTADARRNEQIRLGVTRQEPNPGRDCPACVCPRRSHDGWGCGCGCQMSIVRITRRPV